MLQRRRTIEKYQDRKRLLLTVRAEEAVAPPPAIRAMKIVPRNSAYAINVLNEEQKEISNRFGARQM